MDLQQLIWACALGPDHSRLKLENTGGVSIAVAKPEDVERRLELTQMEGQRPLKQVLAGRASPDRSVYGLG